MTGPTNHLRVGTRSIGEGTCPDYLAAKAHPAMWPAAYVRTRQEKLDTFPLGILNAALNEIERNGATIAQAVDLAVEEMAREGKRLHPAALIWVRTGMAQYLAGAARYQELVQPGSHATVLVRDYWVAREDHRASAGRLWEMYAYGRRYESLDGSVREIRLLHYGIFDPLQSAQESQEAQGQNAGEDRKVAGRAAQEAIAAYSTAFGVPAPWPRPWSGAVPAVTRAAPACRAGPPGPGSPGGTRRRRASPSVRGDPGRGEAQVRRPWCRPGPPGRHAGNSTAGRRVRAVQAADRVRSTCALPRNPRDYRPWSPAAYLVGH